MVLPFLIYFSSSDHIFRISGLTCPHPFETRLKNQGYVFACFLRRPTFLCRVRKSVGRTLHIVPLEWGTLHIGHWTLHIAHRAPWVRDGPFPVPFLTRSADDGIFYCDSITTKFRACPPLLFNTHTSAMQHCPNFVLFEISEVVFCVVAIYSKFACRFGLCPVFRW